MPTKQVTPSEYANRARAALLLAEVLAHTDCSAADAAVLADDGWAQAARAAGLDHSPSCATRSATVAVLTDREVNADPFAGFPR